jgi:uncharacterized protein (TIGR02594 family)
MPGPLQVTAFDIAQRFVGTKEAAGVSNNPMVVAMLKLDNDWPQGDDVAWCSAFVNFVAWILRLPRSKKLNARSWLQIGTPIIDLAQARVGFDVVVLNRAGGHPSPDVLDAPGHVGFFAGVEGDLVQVLGGNQGDSVSLARFPVAQVLGIRRLV